MHTLPKKVISIMSTNDEDRGNIRERYKAFAAYVEEKRLSGNKTKFKRVRREILNVNIIGGK